MIVEEPLDDASQPGPLSGHWLVATFPEFQLDLVEFRDQSLADCPSANDSRRTGTRSCAGMRESQERERFWFSFSPPITVECRKTTELDQSGLFGMQFQTEFRQPLTQFTAEPDCIEPVLETDDEIIRVANDRHIAVSGLQPPLLDP